jgi:putative component of toxin-antitoxin plasmid stabilization module
LGREFYYIFGPINYPCSFTTISIRRIDFGHNQRLYGVQEELIFYLPFCGYNKLKKMISR